MVRVIVTVTITATVRVRVLCCPDEPEAAVCE